MIIYVDSSLREACYVLSGQEPTIIPYPELVTVNVGEYRAVLLALEEARRLELKQVMLLTDSLLVVNQVNGKWRCKKAHLLPYRDKVRKLLKDCPCKLLPSPIKYLPAASNIWSEVSQFP